MGGVRSNHSKSNIPWPNRDISILFEDSTSVEAPPPMGWCMGGWVGWWVGSGQITKNQIYLDLIEIFQFCLKIWHLWRLPPPIYQPMGGGASTDVKSSNRIEISRLGQGILIFSDLTWPHPSTHPTTIHQPMGGGASTDVESSNRIEISRLGQGIFDFEWFDLTPPINPPNHPYTHPWVGEPPQMSNLQTELKYLDSF